MSKINIAFAINDEYTVHLNIAIYSLLKNNSNNHFSINILCKSLSSRNKDSINKILNYYKNASINIVELKKNSDRFNNLKLNIRHISIETYYRYILAELFPEMDRIIYLDADILVVGDIYDLYAAGVDDLYVAGVDDLYVAGVDDLYVAGVDETDNPKRFPGYKESIGFKRDELYVNAGVLLMNLNKIREDSIVQKLFDNTKTLEGKIKFQDQDVINITMQGKMLEVSNVFNFTDQAKKDDKKELIDLAIIHYNGPTKPWENDEFINFQLPYVELYKQYVNDYNELIYKTKDKHAIYCFTTENIGDDIQAIAARRFLPKIDYYINRDYVGKWQNNDQRENVKIIANGWYMHHPYSWPIQDDSIDPLYVSMYVEQYSKAVVDKFLSKRSINNFRDFGAIGARDYSTLNFFKENNIDSYLSGCLTLTLQKDPNIIDQDYILLTDVSLEVYEYVKRSTDRKVIYTTNATSNHMMDIQERFELAEIYLYLYQSAHCVITERLHSALPSLALETPVLLLDKENPVGGNKNRLSGISSLVNYYKEEEFLAGDVYDIEAPPPNPDIYLKYRSKLIKTCTKFTGFDDNISFAWTDINKFNPEEIIDKLEIFKANGLKRTSIELMKETQKNQELTNALAVQNAKVELQAAEISRLMGIKASSKRLAGNIKRRIGRINKR